MKKKGLVLIFLVLVFSVVPGYSQSVTYKMNRIEITPFVGYQFGGSLKAQRGDLRIKDAMNYGVIVNITVRPQTQVEFMYSHQPTELSIKRYTTGVKETLFDLGVNYWQIGGLYEVQPGNVKPFVVMTLGLTHFSPKDSQYSSTTRFSFTFGGGVKVFAGEHIGLRLEGRLLFPYIAGGSGLWCGAPGGCYYTISGTAVVQASLSAGLILAF